MKRAGKILLCLASGLACHAVVLADDFALAKNPYALVVNRNIFGLNPPAPSAAPAAADPPPKITPNGILSIYGHLQVLFKVAVTAPGQAAKDLSYNLSEGQSQDDIAVTSIDEKNGIVTFNNHGTLQELPLIATAASGGSGPAPSGGGIGMPGRIPAPAGMAGGGNGYGQFGAGGPAGGPNPNFGNGGNNSGANFGGGGRAYNSSQTAQPAMSPETQMILIAAQHVKAQQDGDPIAPIFPPTPIDADAGVAPDNGTAAPPAP